MNIVGKALVAIGGSVITAGVVWWWLSQRPPTIICEDIGTESECIGAGCYWYDGACHGKPKSEFEVPWTMIALGGAVVVAGIVAVFIIRR